MLLTPDTIQEINIRCGLCKQMGKLYFIKCSCEFCMDDPTVLAYHENHCVAVKPMNFECIWWDNDSMFVWTLDWDLEVV